MFFATLPLDRHPIFWIADPTPLIVIIAAAMLTLLYLRHLRPPQNSLQIADALGLAMFTISGAQVAEQAGCRAIIVVLMGTMTGVAGGVVRDVLTTEIPLILRKSNIYATAAVAGASLYLLLQAAGLQRGAAALIGMACVAALRIAAILWSLQLPAFSLPGEERRP